MVAQQDESFTARETRISKGIIEAIAAGRSLRHGHHLTIIDVAKGIDPEVGRLLSPGYTRIASLVTPLKERISSMGWNVGSVEFRNPKGKRERHYALFWNEDILERMTWFYKVDYDRPEAEVAVTGELTVFNNKGERVGSTNIPSSGYRFSKNKQAEEKTMLLLKVSDYNIVMNIFGNRDTMAPISLFLVHPLIGLDFSGLYELIYLGDYGLRLRHGSKTGPTVFVPWSNVQNIQQETKNLDKRDQF